MKRLFTIVLLLLAVVCAVSAEAYNVSFFTSHSISKVAYSIEHGGKMIDVDMSKIYEISTGDKVYATVNMGSGYIDVTSFKLRSYDGNRSDERTLDAEKTEDGKLCFTLSDLGALKEWSVEPVLTRKPVTITMKCLVGEDSVAGAWKVNDKGVNGDSYEISSLTDFTVSCTFDADAYYFVSSQPKELAESGGRVFFSLQKGSDDSSAETDYTINLERYSSISLGENKARFNRLVYNGEEYGDRDSIEKLKLKKGESFYVYTASGYVVAKDSSLVVVSQTATGTGEWETELKVSEDSLAYKYVINIREEKKATFNIELKGFDSADAVKEADIIISVDEKKQNLDYKKAVDVSVSEGQILTINIPSGPGNVKYDVLFSDYDGSLAGYDCDDIKQEYERTFGYTDLTDLEKIVITREAGLRANTIQKQIEDARNAGISVAYYVHGEPLLDGDFLPYGTKVLVKVAGEISEDMTVEFNGEQLQSDCEAWITVDENTTVSDFNLDIVKIPGFLFNFDYRPDGILNGSITFMCDGVELKGEVFIKVGDKITWNASVSSDDFFISGNSNGIIEISTKDDSVKFYDVWNNVSFIDKSESEEYSKTVILRNPQYGSVVYYYNGKKVSGSSSGEIYAELPVTTGDKDPINIAYSYVGNPTSGFDYPTINKSTRTADGWVFEKVENGYYTWSKVLTDKTSAFTPIELIETSGVRPSVVVDVESDVVKSGKGVFFLSYSNNGSTVTVYSKGEEDASYKKNKVDKTISSTDILTLNFRGYEIPSGKVLQIEYLFTYAKGDSGWYRARTNNRNNFEFEIDGYRSSKGISSQVRTINIHISFVTAEKYVNRSVVNSSVVVKSGNTILDSNLFVSPDDDVTLTVKPNDGYYIDGDDDNIVEKTVKYKNLDQELKKITVKKCIKVTLKNIHPGGKSCTYQVNGKDVMYGTYNLKEGDKVTVTLKDMGSGYKVNNIALDIVANITNKDGNFKEDMTIKSTHQGKTLTLEDFNIERK